jgi:hypothetical protein
MAENFTAKQKEIVARKMGYEGPMQGFDDFLNSSPSLGMRYSSITSKFAERMAKGGVVRKKRGYAVGGVVTAAQIQAELAAGPQTQEALDAALLKYSPAEMAAAFPQYGNVADFNNAALEAAQRVEQQTREQNREAMRADPGNAVTTVSAPPNPQMSDVPLSELEAARNRLTPEQRQFIDWQVTQINPNTGQRIIDEYKRQGANPYASGERAQEQIDRAKNREALFTQAGVAPTADIAPWTNPNWAAEQKAREDAERARMVKQYADYMSIPEGQRPVAGPGGQSTGFSYGPGLDQQMYTPFSTTSTAGRSSTPTTGVQNTGGGTPTSSQIANTPGMGTGGIGVNIQPLPTGSTTTVGGTTGVTPGTAPTQGTPTVPGTPTYTAAQTAITPGMMAQANLAGPTATATAAPAVEAAGVTAPAPIAAPTITAAQSAPGVTQALTGVKAEQGTLSQQAQMAAATQDPRTTAVAGLTAAQGQAAQVVAPAARTAQAGEMVSGAAVDMGRVDTELAKTQAAQGVVSEEMTVQGQLNKLLSNFDAGAPPPWAAASLRTATAQLAARGLGASSLAGQAIIQATLEAATPIAAADAKVFEQMGLQNLSNRQQIAVLVGQQRAQFLGQEFDQNFQTRVINAAKISDIANKNFDAATTIALENARLTNSMDLANLSARNALVLEQAAAMSRLETQNLNNRQQAAVQNAQSFLQMDMKNLDNRQQTAMFKAQAVVNSLVSDAGFENATRATNASNKLEADKISATLALTAQQFSASEKNKLAVANMDAANELIKFNAQERNDRDDFNAKMATEINVANARLLAEVSTANTAAVNAANAVNAKNATDLSASQYAQQSQTYRDLLEMSWKTGESGKDRIANLAIASIQKDVANIKADGDSSAAWGKLLIEGLKNWDTLKSLID